MITVTRTFFGTLTAIALLVFALGPSDVEAQNEAGAVYLGFQGGLTQSSVTGSGIESSGRQGYTGGFHVMYNLTDMLSAQMDFLYTERGAEGVNADSGPNVSSAYDLSDSVVDLKYFDFPLLFKATAPIDQVKLSAMAGPAISFQTGATIDGDEVQRHLESNPRVQNRFLLYDLLGIVGGELAVPLPGISNSEVALDARYQFGLKNVEQTQDMELKNRSFSGSLLFRFAL